MPCPLGHATRTPIYEDRPSSAEITTKICLLAVPTAYVDIG
ncbi:hypothetical protein [Nostoc sp.]